MMRKYSFVLGIVWLACAGCSVNEVVTAEETELIVATTPVDEEMLLDIGIVQFDTGIPADVDPAEEGIYEEIRLAEARYLPFHLKTTLQGTGHWGAVRVIPSRDAFTDVIISGTIEKSDGEFVTLKVRVDDASGRHWYSKPYSAQTGSSSFAANRDRRLDPYQKVFNDIANDLQIYVAQFPKKDVERVQQISELQFFNDMSPLAYSDYLETDEDGIVTVVRLPAENDPAVARLRQIRERDRLVVDTLNEHYANFYYGIAIPYQSWRKTAREEAINYRQVKRSATLQTLLGAAVVAGSLAMDTNSGGRQTRNVNRALQGIAFSEGMNTLFRGVSRRSEANMYIESIKELSESFGAEAAPMVVEVEGETRNLTGTAEAQYESWRRLLRQIYEAETGFTESIEVGTPARAPEPAG
jgi:hypothetical protein